MVRRADRIKECRSGAVALEYALIASLIVVAILGGLDAVGGSTNDMYNNVGSKVDAAHNGGG